MTTIDSFSGEYAFLSNFAPVEIQMADGLVAKTVEHAYQALKSEEWEVRIAILASSTPAIAKKAGRHIVIRERWDQLKVPAMRILLRAKFTQEPYRTKLLETGDATLIEGNWWGDTYWGVCRGVGENYLGRLLMEMRAELRGCSS